MPREHGSPWGATGISRLWFGAVHPKNRTPFRSIVFLVPVALIFAYFAPLDQVITFSILSGLLGYTYMSFNVIMFRKKWPLDYDQTRVHSSVPPAAGSRAAPSLLGHVLCGVPGLRNAARRDDVVLCGRVNMVPLPSLPLCSPWRSVHDAVASPGGLLSSNNRSGRNCVLPPSFLLTFCFR